MYIPIHTRNNICAMYAYKILYFSGGIYIERERGKETPLIPNGKTKRIRYIYIYSWHISWFWYTKPVTSIERPQSGNEQNEWRKKTYKIKTKKIKTWRRTHGILTTCQLVNRSKQRTLVFPSCVIFRLF